MANLEDVAILERLLREFGQRLEARSAVDCMLPFLRRFYDLGISATASQHIPDRTAGLIRESRGPAYRRQADTLSILFHVQEQRTIAVASEPDVEAIFSIEGLGRGLLTRRAGRKDDRRLPGPPDGLAQLIEAAVDHKTPVEFLWSDGACWPDNQQDAALVAEDFPWPQFLDHAVVK
jgi:hypothetical protein